MQTLWSSVVTNTHWARISAHIHSRETGCKVCLHVKQDAPHAYNLSHMILTTVGEIRRHILVIATCYRTVRYGLLPTVGEIWKAYTCYRTVRYGLLPTAGEIRKAYILNCYSNYLIRSTAWSPWIMCGDLQWMSGRWGRAVAYPGATAWHSSPHYSWGTHRDRRATTAARTLDPGGREG